MVGSGSGYSRTEGNLLDLSAVLKLNYPKTANLSTSLVTGSVESLDEISTVNYFEPISVIGFSQNAYDYTSIPQAENTCSGLSDGEDSLGLGSDTSICSTLYRSVSNGFELDYGNHNCSVSNCSPFDGKSGFLPHFMTVGGIQCSDGGRLHLYLGFSNSRHYSHNVPFVPERTIIGEGIWNGKKNRLCIVGCQLSNFTDSLASTSVGECTVRFTLRFPAVLSIRVRNMAMGHIWTDRSAKEPGYFEKIAFRSSENRLAMAPDLRYEYTQLDRVRKSCVKKDSKRSGKRYPDGHSFQDMRFDMSVKDTKRNSAWGHSTPLSIGDIFDKNPYSSLVASSLKSTKAVPILKQSLLNVSYIVSYTMYSDEHMQTDISAEGVYDSETGSLCMVGCRYLGSSSRNSTTVDSMDCEILINVELSPLNSESGKHLKGTIRSTRENMDPFYFEPLEISSNTQSLSQAKESLWRMDLEIAMVLISLTLACVFIGLQLFHVKKHPDVLPSISLMMVTVLTLGHMIPLVLNFEAFFFRHRNRQNVLLWSGGLLEVNEVIVRLVTMVAFLLQFRLLQLSWSARLAEERKRGTWAAERKALWLCLTLYFVGGLIALFVHWKTLEAPLLKVHHIASRHSIWEDLRSYAGLILDGFLLPQILFNIFWNSNDKALAPSFYIGTTVVRSLPHAYDAYRGHKYRSNINTPYIYANPAGDLYSTAWDAIIPFSGLLFCIGIYLQQRFGGCCILSPKFRQSVEYEKVPVVGA